MPDSISDGAPPASGRTSVAALLGPTNTGKTHRAVERMLEHDSGMMGLPLRLLAREIYDRITARIGERAVALVTGEEKRVPRRPRYWICTVESMPVDLAVDFVAIDEVQLCAHPQRGHVFTDRILHARGTRETWFLGADTMVPMMEELVPVAARRRHPRLSQLRVAAPTSLGSLPPRTAVIAFSAEEVYELAEKLRRRRGGAAVVLGALSPRTRNAQVAMYQAGEVDFLVATDAVGMGLNMDVHHVAFASLRKFDGRETRALSPAELGQIAGRAGRYTRDGTFGTVSPVTIPDDVAFAIETHRFSPVRRVWWRNSDLVFDSVATLLESLGRRPPRTRLSLQDDADDEAVLRVLSQRPDIAAFAKGPERVALLWDVCRIPDFRRFLVEHHARLLAELYLQLVGRGHLDPSFMDERIARLESDQGDIDTLMMRMESIRTWNYIAHHGHWVRDAEAWQARTQRAEDRLSDALHERLTERFVEHSGKRRRHAPRRSSRRRGAPEEMSPPVADGPFAKLADLRASLPSDRGELPEVDESVEEVVEAPHQAFHADAFGHVWVERAERSQRLARLIRGNDLLHPDAKLIIEPPVGAGDASRLLRRVRAWVRDFVDDVRGVLGERDLDQLSPPARGLMYELEMHLGSLDLRAAGVRVRDLQDGDRELLSAWGIVVGHRHLYLEGSIAPDALRRRFALCAAAHGRLPFAPRGHRPSSPLRRGVSPALCTLCGHVALGPLAVRVDVAERVGSYLHHVSKRGVFKLPRKVPQWLECSRDVAERVVIGLGYDQIEEGFVRARRSRRGRRARSSGRGHGGGG